MIGDQYQISIFIYIDKLHEQVHSFSIYHGRLHDCYLKPEL